MPFHWKTLKMIGITHDGNLLYSLEANVQWLTINKLLAMFMGDEKNNKWFSRYQNKRFVRHIILLH